MHSWFGNKRIQFGDSMVGIVIPEHSVSSRDS
jgi:hypothetical protein